MKDKFKELLEMKKTAQSKNNTISTICFCCHAGANIEQIIELLLKAEKSLTACMEHVQHPATANNRYDCEGLKGCPKCIAKETLSSIESFRKDE